MRTETKSSTSRYVYYNSWHEMFMEEIEKCGFQLHPCRLLDLGEVYVTSLFLDFLLCKMWTIKIVILVGTFRRLIKHRMQRTQHNFQLTVFS